MKRHTTALILVFTLILPLCFTACQQPNSDLPATDSTTPSGQSATQPSAPVVVTPEDPDKTILTVPADFEVRRGPEEIFLPAFTEAELGSALGVVEQHLDAISEETGTLTYQVERIAYDPIMTDVHVRQKIAGAPVAGWTEADYYQRQISFAVTYSATYDHQKSPVQDVQHNVTGVHLNRENDQSPWEFLSSGLPVEEYSNCAMSAGELSEITGVSGRILAGYQVSEDEARLYLRDDSTGATQHFQKVRHARPAKANQPKPTESVKPTEPSGQLPASLAVWDESNYQVGAAVTPQPGDTQKTWDASRAATYPADGDCSDLELLEKWMAVEGLTMEDLDERNCQQLVLVVARETDGVKTDTICYQRQADGAWAAVDGLSRMQGWTGGNGILHGRLRDSNTSPAGLWSLGLAFGNAQKPSGLKMPWRDITPHTDWVCDADSIYYNTWQERDDPNLLEGWNDDVEHLEDYPNTYAYACVIRFNTAPYTIPDRGCAIFLHCSKQATGGCIGLPEADLVNTLLWLDPTLNPYILITGSQKDSL